MYICVSCACLNAYRVSLDSTLIEAETRINLMRKLFRTLFPSVINDRVVRGCASSIRASVIYPVG